MQLELEISLENSLYRTAYVKLNLTMKVPREINPLSIVTR